MPLQYFLALVIFSVGAFLGTQQIGSFIQGRRVELDPSADRVIVDGAYVARFQDVRQFSSYITHGSKGSIAYHLQIDLLSAQPIDIGSVDMRADTLPLGQELNKYLAEVRPARSGG